MNDFPKKNPNQENRVVNEQNDGKKQNGENDPNLAKQGGRSPQPAHPNSTILATWFYEKSLDPEIDSSWNKQSLEAHLNKCLNCQESLRSFQSVDQFLEGSTSPKLKNENLGQQLLLKLKTEGYSGRQNSEENLPPSTTNTTKAKDQLPASTDASLDTPLASATSVLNPHSTPNRLSDSNKWFSWHSFAIAASFLLMTGMSFFFGMRYQADLTRQTVQEQIDANFRKLEMAMAKKESASEEVWKKEDFQKWIDKQILVARSTDKQQSDLAVRKALNDLSGQINAILTNQNAMKSDILTVAVNADKEIKIAKNDILQIKQYVSQFLTARP